MRSADDEAAGRIDEDPQVLVAELFRDHLVDDRLGDFLPDLLERHVVVVLGRNDDGVNAFGRVTLVLDRDLRLAVGTQKLQRPVFARFGELTREIVREHDRQRHQLRRLAASEPEHHALVAGAGQLERVFLPALLHFERFVDAHRDVGRLFVDRDRNAAGRGIEIVADIRHGLPDEFRNVDVRLGRDLARHVHLARDDERFARHAPHGILSEDRIEHGVGDLVRDFVGMPLGHGLRRKETAIRHLGSLAQDAMYFTCSAVGLSIVIFIAANLSSATSSSISFGTE